jgi:hypothetical protein
MPSDESPTRIDLGAPSLTCDGRESTPMNAHDFTPEEVH